MGVLQVSLVALRVLRQGDPLSSLLFFMVTDVLSKMINKAEVRFILGFFIDNGSCQVFHLQFADDTMIFCEANLLQLDYLRCILCCFEAVSGLKINLSKSDLFPIG